MKRVKLHILWLAVAVIAAQITASAATLTSDLLSVETKTTVAGWMRAHPHDTLQYETVAHSIEPFSEANCAVASAQVQYSGLTFHRRAIFHIPGPDKPLPATDGPFPKLLRECELSEIDIRTDVIAPPTDLVLQLQKNFSTAAGAGKPFQPTDLDIERLRIEAKSVSGFEWSRGGSRWIIALDSSTRSIIASGFAKVSQGHDDDHSTFIQEATAKAQRLAATTGLPAADINRMTELLKRANSVTDTQDLAPFLLRWVHQARNLSPDLRAAALYSADALLAHLPTEKTAGGLAKQLTPAGIEYQQDELGGGYSYSHRLLQEALQVAPDSPAGQQAFLELLHAGFDPGCCVSGNGFEEVIKRTTQYLKEYPQTPIKGKLLLAIGDAYRDPIAIVNGANGDPFNDAPKYKPGVDDDRYQALRYYRAAIHASPGTDTAREAFTEAWALLAGLPPLDSRFVRLYD